MKGFLLLGLLAVGAVGSRDYGRKEGRYKEVGYKKQYVYHGRYGGKCHTDGLYYRDDASFVICTNGNDYIQPCAPGTKNEKFDDYSYGDSYDTRDFCAINLVDIGYGTKGKKYGYPIPVKTVVKHYEKGKERGYDYKDNRYGYEQHQDKGYHKEDKSYGKHDDYGHEKHGGYGARDYDNHPRGYGKHPRGYDKHPRGYSDGPHGYEEPRGYDRHPHGYRDDSHGYRNEPHGYGYEPRGYGDKSRGYDDHYDGYGEKEYSRGYKVKEDYVRYNKDDGYRKNPYDDHNSYHGDRYDKPGYTYGPKYEVEAYSKDYSKKNYGYGSYKS